MANFLFICLGTSDPFTVILEHSQRWSQIFNNLTLRVSSLAGVNQCIFFGFGADQKGGGLTFTVEKVVVIYYIMLQTCSPLHLLALPSSWRKCEHIEYFWILFSPVQLRPVYMNLNNKIFKKHLNQVLKTTQLVGLEDTDSSLVPTPFSNQGWTVTQMEFRLNWQKIQLSFNIFLA